MKIVMTKEQQQAVEITTWLINVNALYLLLAMLPTIVLLAIGITLIVG